MDLLISTTAIMVASVIFSVLPFMFSGLRKHSKTLNFVGGVALTALLIFDVIPEMMEHGGAWSLLVTVAAFGVFTAAHILPGRRHAHGAGPNHTDAGCNAGNWLAGSLALHCLACGLLLCGAHEVSETFANHVGFGLVLHKAVEAFALSSLLLDKAYNKRQLVIAIGVYTIAFPLGVAIAEFGIGGEGLERVAILATSLGIGALFGCLVQDFFIPTLKDLKLITLRSKESI